MRAAMRVAMALLLVAAVAAHGHHHHDHRRLLKAGNLNGNRKGKGPRFDFARGTARAFLDSIDQSQLEKVRSRGHFKDTKALALELESDPALGVDDRNSSEVQLIYACAGLAVPASAAPRAIRGAGAQRRRPGAVTAAAAPGESLNGANPSDADPAVDRVWALSSRPNAPKKLWLDFKGNTYTGTAWNDASRPSIVVPPYSTDADTTSFTSTELANIVAIWRGVAEDYSMFNVDVTTISQAGTSPQNYMRVSIGGSSSLLGMSAGGVAYVGVFGRSDTTYQPAFVFPNELGGGFPKYIWEAVSHEVGHTMGLSHDGRTKSDGTTEGYYTGTNGWAPIMGVGYYQPVSQWSKGEYQGANQKQDDLAIIAGKLSYVTSGNGNTLATATPLTPAVSASTATASAFGIVSQTGAVDMFKLQAGGGTLSFSVSVLNAWGTYGRANLDAAVKVLDANGNAVTSSQNTAGLTVTGTAVLPSAGTYYFAVSGSGSGDPLTTGYSSYGSLGQFSLQATYPGFTATASPEPSPSPSPAPQTPNPDPIPSPSPSPIPTPNPTPSPEVSAPPSPSPEVFTPSSPSPAPSPNPSPSPEVASPPSPSPEVFNVPSPSPSPSPKDDEPPSPSPEVQSPPSPPPSPSPSPKDNDGSPPPPPEVAPSPSPNPPPTPSPPPSKRMKVNIARAISSTRDRNRRSYTCVFTLEVEDASSNGLSRAAVSGIWTTPSGTAPIPFSGLTAARGWARGQLTLTYKAPAAARGCTARITSVSLAGYALDTDLDSLTQTTTW